MLFLIHATYHYTFIAGIFASIKPLLDGSLSVNKVCKNHKGLKLHQEEPLNFFCRDPCGQSRSTYMQNLEFVAQKMAEFWSFPYFFQV